MKNIILLLICLTAFNVAYANDGPFYFSYGGTLLSLKTEHPSIQMESEIVKIYLYEGYYEVIATFDFVNLGDSTTVIMGFPENLDPPLYTSEMPDVSFRPLKFEGIVSFIDGNITELKREIILTVINKNKIFLPYWTKSVKFNKNQRRKVQVRYYTGGYFYNFSSYNFEYNFTGEKWFKKVNKSKLIIIPAGDFIPKEPFPDGIKMENGMYVFEKSNWEAEYRFKWGGKITGPVKKIKYYNNYIYELYDDTFNNEGYPKISHYLIKNFYDSILYVSPYILSFNKDIKITDNLKSDNILEIIQKYDDFFLNKKMYFTEYDLNESCRQCFSFQAEQVICDYIKLSEKVGESIFYYLVGKDYPHNVANSSFVSEPGELTQAYSKDCFESLSVNSKKLETEIQSYNFIEKILFPNKYRNILEAYVLQLIFLEKEEDAWKCFDEYFPILGDKEISKKFILDLKQKILIKN